MESAALHALLHQLLAAWENEVVEFKEASKDYKTAEIFQYFSALSNEANLRGANSAWLVFGVRNKDKQIVGTDFRLQHDHLHSLKQQVKQSTGSISFREIHELMVDGKRVLLFEIPPAPRGMPVFANGHAYARAGESLKGLDMFQLDTIRNQTLAEDWSAQLVDGATTADLDQRALQKARQDFIQKHANRLSAEEVMGWSEEAFLGKLRLLHKNKLTRAALLLFGKPEASVFLSPHPAQLTWKLEGEEKAYEHFGLPFYLTSSELYKRLCHNKQLINSHFYRGVSELPYKLLFAVIYTHLEFRYEVSHTITSHHVHHFHQTRIPDGTLLDYMVQYRKPLFPQFFLYPKKFLPENNPHHKEFHLRPYIQNNANQ